MSILKNEIKNKDWRTRSITEKQIDYIKKQLTEVGVDPDEIRIPQTRGEASIFIMSLNKVLRGEDYYEEKNYPHIEIIVVDKNGKPLDPQPPENDVVINKFFSDEELAEKGIIKPTTKVKHKKKSE